jgi:hypothetical protein
MLTTTVVRAIGPLDEAKRALGVELIPTGSRVICPQVCLSSSDWDYLGCVVDLRGTAERLISNGWTTGTSLAEVDAGATEFISLRKQSVNLILTNCQQFFGRFQLATRVATKLGLTNKGDRIALFQALLYGNG